MYPALLRSAVSRPAIRARSGVRSQEMLFATTQPTRNHDASPAQRPTSACCSPLSPVGGVRSYTTPTIKRLSEVLERVATHEYESGGTKLPEELKTLKKNMEGEWNIDYGVSTVMKKTDSDGREIKVTFHTNEAIGGVYKYPPEKKDEGPQLFDKKEIFGDALDQDDKYLDSVFTVEVKRGDDKKMVYYCESSDGELKITYVETINLEKKIMDSSSYFKLPRPLMFTFDGAVAKEFQITNDLAEFIMIYNQFRRKRRYLLFLRHAKELLDA